VRLALLPRWLCRLPLLAQVSYLFARFCAYVCRISGVNVLSLLSSCVRVAASGGLLSPTSASKSGAGAGAAVEAVGTPEEEAAKDKQRFLNMLQVLTFIHLVHVPRPTGWSRFCPDLC
jgi:hypothetical protein